MKSDVTAFKLTANNWIAEQRNSIKHGELDIKHCFEKIQLIKEEIRLAEESITLSTDGIQRYIAAIRNGEYGEKYKNITFIDN